MTDCNNSKRKYFTPWDLLPLTVVLLAFVMGLGLLAFSRSEGELTAVISVRGEVYCEIPLASVSEPYELAVEGDGTAVLSVSSQGVAFKTSDCPDKLCVNTGLLTRSGESAVCLPARVSVKIVSDNDSDTNAPDAVAG